MKRIIMLMSGAMLLTINVLQAQLVASNLDAPYKKKTEIGLNMQDFGTKSIFIRREIKPNRFLHIDAKLGGYALFSNQYNKIGIGIDKQIAITQNQKWQAYHGWNLSVGKQSYYDSNSLSLARQYSIGVGYRLGVRYNISKHWFVGAEANPQFTFTTNKGSNVLTVESDPVLDKLQMRRNLGQGNITLGFRF